MFYITDNTQSHQLLANEDLIIFLLTTVLHLTSELRKPFFPTYSVPVVNPKFW